jgi:mono/diheme cytochrome c family protein
VYTQYCAECHGARLEGQPNWKVPDANGVYPAPPHDASGHTWHHPDVVLLEIIAHGGSMHPTAMPAFGETLDKQEMRAVLAYIKVHWGVAETEFQEQVTQNAQER